MRDDDAKRLRTKTHPSWKPDFKCACCGATPWCPQLRDEVWAQAWGAFAAGVDDGQTGHREPVCSTPLQCSQLDQSLPNDQMRHVARCEINRGLRHLLCLECAERALGRQLTLDDLEACGGNYAHYVMQTRLREDLELSIRCLSEVPGDR